MEELAKIEKDTLTTITKNSISDIIKPLTNEIHLFDTYIAGTTHISKHEIFDNLNIGNELILIREDNKFDEKAILIMTKDKEKLGYIPEKDNVIFSRLMDAGKLLKAKIKSIDKKGSFNKIAISIYLYDF
ncbi:MAG: HIRAN domain-containing protein [Lachnospiraceae bacterium]|nr:HIRAN domain-containing protein [Lachnospiraceae bacterium]